MATFSIFSIPFVSKACRTDRDKRTKLQVLLVSIINGLLRLGGKMPWNAPKYAVTIFRGQAYHESLCDLRTWVLYDRGGYLYGWYGQNREGYGFFQAWAELHGDKPRPRMKLFSRLRSPKLPAPDQAEIIGPDETVVGYTTYNEVK